MQQRNLIFWIKKNPNFGGEAPHKKKIFFKMFKKKMFLDNFFQNFKNSDMYMKDAECAETNEKLVFQFFVLEI